MRIAIWGTSGAGKTTLIKNLIKRPQFKGYQALKEPVTKNPYFKAGYSPELEVSRANSYKTEIWMLTHRWMQLQKAKGRDNVFFDRTLLDQIVFAHADYKTGRLSEADWKVFESYFSKVIIPNLKKMKPFDYIVYLKVNNQTALKRMYNRGLHFELDFDPDFWKQLNASYEYYLDYMQSHFPGRFMVIWGNSNSPKLLVNSLVKALEYRAGKKTTKKTT